MLSSSFAQIMLSTIKKPSDPIPEADPRKKTYWRLHSPERRYISFLNFSLFFTSGLSVKEIEKQASDRYQQDYLSPAILCVLSSSSSQKSTPSLPSPSSSSSFSFLAFSSTITATLFLWSFDLCFLKYSLKLTLIKKKTGKK